MTDKTPGPGRKRQPAARRNEMTLLATNGNKPTVHSPPSIAPELPDDRKAAIEYGLTQFQTIADERDRLFQEVRELRSMLAEREVALDARQAHIADMESRVNSAMMIRDQAVADRAKYETMFISIFAQLRAFDVPTAPLVREANPVRANEDAQQ
jgi:hypothetical protein